MFLLIHKKILYENSSKNPLRFEFNYIKPMDQFGNISPWYILTILSLNTCISLFKVYTDFLYPGINDAYNCDWHIIFACNHV